MKGVWPVSVPQWLNYGLGSHLSNVCMYLYMLTNDCQVTCWELTCLYKFNIQARSLRVLSPTRARNCIWIEKGFYKSFKSIRSFIVDPLSYFSFQPVLHDWCNTVYSVSFPVCGMVRIKTTLLLIGESNTCIAGIGFPISLSDWSLVNDL